MFIPWWLKAAVIAVAFAMGMGLMWQLDQGKIEKLRGKIAMAKAESSETQQQNKALRDQLTDIDLELKMTRELQADAERRYDEAISKPPETVVRWRDRWREVPTEIEAEPCNEQVADFVRILQRAMVEVTP